MYMVETNLLKILQIYYFQNIIEKIKQLKRNKIQRNSFKRYNDFKISNKIALP